MRVVKPLRATFVHRVFSHRKKHFFAATVGYCISFDDPRRPVTEVEMWKMASSDLGRFGVLDHWMWKPQAEILVTGACYTGDEPKTSDSVRLVVGADGRRLVDKTLSVFGDRHWTLIGPSEPAPFTRMPIDYGHTFGGAAYAPNPLGKGHAPVVDEASGLEEHALPNVEEPRHLLTSRAERGSPASFAPRDPSWPHGLERRSASHDPALAQLRGSRLADEVDLSVFNVASADQRVKGYFEGTESLRVEHMHPDRRVLETTLPGFRGRCLVRFAESDRVLDVPLSLDTLHVFPHRERVIVFFRGLVEVHAPDASDVALCVVGLEDAEAERRSVDAYLRVAAARLEPERGALAALCDRDLLPTSAILPDLGFVDVGAPPDDEPLADERGRDGLRRAEREYATARAGLIARGVEPELLPPPPAAPPSPPKNVDEVAWRAVGLADDEATITARRSAVERDVRREMGALFAEHGVHPSTLGAHGDGGGPPTFSADGEITKLEETLAASRRSGLEIPGLASRLADPTLRASLLEIEKELHVAYRLGAHAQAKAAPMSDEASRGARAELAAIVVGAARERRDFTGAHLAGLDLRGIDLEGVFLEGADLSGADLRGANLRDAVLARANLAGARLDGADLERANLGRARAVGARLDGANLTRAILYEADLSSASLARARLAHANTLDMRCRGTDFTEVDAEGLVFFRAELSGARFRGARVVRSVFVECDATGIDCAHAELSGSAFVASKADGADLSDAVADSFRVVASTFERASFRGARMPGSNLREARLRGASFAGANLRRSLLSGADLREIDASRAILVECLLIDADLTRASLVGANLMLAILHRAVLRGVDASGSSLYCADLTGAVGDAETNLSGSNVRRALVAGVVHG